MKKLISTAFSITLLSVALTGCSWDNTTSESKATYVNFGAVGYKFTPVNTVEGDIPSQDVLVY